MTCKECQQPITEEQKTCPNCGAPVEPQSSARGTEASALKRFISSALQKLMPRTDVNLHGSPLYLWKPWLIALWFIPFLGIWVGSALVAINWWTLRKRYWAAWALAFIPLEYAASGWLMPDSVPFVIQILASFGAWLIIVAAPQIWFIQQYCGQGYERRRWLAPIGLGLIIGFALPKVAEYLERTSEGAASPSSAQLAAAAQSQQVARELTVEDVVKAKSGLVVPLEITWTETSLLIFTAKKSAKGSAVIIGTKSDTVLFATNRHVVEVPENAENIERHVLNGDRRHPFTLASQLTDDLDLALIAVRVLEQFSTNTIPSAALNDVVVGEECVAIGNTLGHGISVTTGIISKFDSMASFYANAHDSLVLIRTSAPISPGNSGGALFRRKDGKLIGITTATQTRGQNVNFVLPVEYLWKLKLVESSTK